MNLNTALHNGTYGKDKRVGQLLSFVNITQNLSFKQEAHMFCRITVTKEKYTFLIVFCSSFVQNY